MQPVRNHTDAQLKKSPFNKHDEISDEDELDDSPTMKDGKINFDELFKKSNKLHSRQGGQRIEGGSQSVGRILKSTKKNQSDDEDETDDFSDLVGLANR
jgi:hypothetical protein